MVAASYATFVDQIASEIAAGSLRPGDRLPPQREFAYAKGIAASTAGRVYAELLRRGLVVGEVGRGTFVAGRNASDGPAAREPQDGPIDLEFNFPTVAGQGRLIARSLAGLQRPDAMAAAVGPVTRRRLDAARAVTAGFLASPGVAGQGWRPVEDALVFTGSGRQSIAAAVSTLVPVGGRLAVEAMTYPMVKSIAARLGVTTVPIALDAEGPRPDLVERAHRAGALQALYLQPVLHNPLGHTMGPERRRHILRLAARLDIPIIEDMVYGFLGDGVPLAAEAPDRCLVVDSLSKRLAPGIAVGLLHVPRAIRDRVAATVRGGAWTVSPLALEAGMRLLADGTAAEVVQLKRADARARQAIVAEALAEHDLHTDPRSYHVWLTLPEGWRSERFAAVAARAGIAITPSSAFAVAPGHAPNAVRLALGLPSHDELRQAAQRLAGLLDRHPDDADVTE